MSRDNELNCLNNIKNAFCKSNNMHIDACNCNREKIRKIFLNANENEDSNTFPDFNFEGGIIEHFIITGYKESKKGSAFKIEESKANKETDIFFKEEDKKFLNSPRNPGTYHTISHENTYSNSVYKDFL